MGKGAFQQRIGRGEEDKTHQRCIRWLMKLLGKNRLRLVTNVFLDYPPCISGNNPQHKEQQVIFEQKENYSWFSEKDARIAFGDGSYIEPDIGGRNPSCFFPKIGHQTILIEVIQTHFPDRETFFHLLNLSGCNHLVVFFFVTSGEWASDYNRVSVKDENMVEIRPAHYLLGGEVFKNGKPCSRQEGEKNEDWYNYLSNTYFRQAMEGKESRSGKSEPFPPSEQQAAESPATSSS